MTGTGPTQNFGQGQPSAGGHESNRADAVDLGQHSALGRHDLVDCSLRALLSPPPEHAAADAATRQDSNTRRTFAFRRSPAAGYEAG